MSNSESCPNCKSRNLVQNILPTNDVHYAKLTCGNCNHYIKWLSKSKMFEVSIARLLYSTDLEEWERRFLKSITYRTPTKAEIIVVEAIQVKVNPVAGGRGSG